MHFVKMESIARCSFHVEEVCVGTQNVEKLILNAITGVDMLLN